MQDDKLIQQVVEQVQKEIQAKERAAAPASKAPFCDLTEFVGTAFGDSVGLVIANVDDALRQCYGIDSKYRSIGIVGARVGAGPQIMACDEAVKASNTELIKFELPRDTKGNGGHGSLAIFGAEDVSDARRAVEMTLNALSWTFGDIYMNEAGFVELQYTARASYALSNYFKAPLGKAWGLSVGCPASVGVVMADAAVKSANVEILMHATPALNTSHSNEFMIMITGDSGAVKQAIIAAREMGRRILRGMGDETVSLQKPYIL